MPPRKYFTYNWLKYTKPIWYFHLMPYNDENNVWIEYEQLSLQEKELIQLDEDYSNSKLSNWDTSYQALMKGIIKQAGNNIQTEEIELVPADIYRFIRKYHKKIWLYFTFFQRIFSLFNPISEFIGLWQTRQVKNSNLFHTYYKYGKYPDFDSSLIKSHPLLSIIIPTYNRYESLINLLDDLQKQIYTNFTVIVIDQSNPFQKESYSKLNFSHHVIRQKEPALWRARNSGIKSAESEYLLFLDDDSKIAPDWILEHLKCMDYFQADISSGISISKIGAKVPENYSFFRWSDQLDTGNVLIKRKVFEKCGLFDEQFEKMRMGDGEFGVRAYLNGFKAISNPQAKRIHFKHIDGGLRELGTWDAFRPTNFFKPRPVPSVLYFWRKYWGNEAAFISSIINLPISFTPYKQKGNQLANLLSIILFLIFSPFVSIMFILTWKKSSNMLNEGALIDNLICKNIHL